MIPPAYVKRIRPPSGWMSLDLRRLLAYRELIFFLAWRDITTRYRQTVLGFFWGIIQPLAQWFVLSFVFGEFARVASDGVPYPLFSLVGLTPWRMFISILGRTSGSMIGNAGILTKVYFPRLVFPSVALVTTLVDMIIPFGILAATLVVFGVPVRPEMLLGIPLLLIALATGLGIGLWASVLNVRSRDAGYLLGFITQALLYLTPIIYPLSNVPEQWRPLLYLNPMTAVVEGFRWTILTTGQAPGLPWFIAGAMSLVLLISGLFYFQRVEKTFADII